MQEHPEESDQLPEEAPHEQVPKDTDRDRDEATETPGAGEQPKRAIGDESDDHGTD